MGIITALTVLDNGLNRLIYGYDSYGNVCDNKNSFFNVQNTTLYRQDTAGLPFVFYFNYTDPIDSRKVCVKSCPNKNIASIDDFKNFTSFNNFTVCDYGVTPGMYDPKKCPKLPIIQTYPLINRCIPNIEKLVLDGIVDSKYGQYLEDQFQQSSEIAKLSIVQVYDNLPKIGLIALASLLITIVLVFLLRYIAHIVIYLIMLITSIGSIGITIFLWLRFVEIEKSGSTVRTTIPIIGIELQVATSFLIYAIITSLATMLLLLIIFIMRKRIGLVIKLVAEAQKTLADMPMLFLLPVLTILLLIMFLIYWIITALMIYSFGEYHFQTLIFMNINLNKSNLAKIMWVYHFIALIWISEFIFACQAMVISGSVARWYFTRNKASLKTPICGSLSHLLVYHMGSVAFGAFIITLIRFPRYVLSAIQRKMKAAGPESIVTQILKAFTCCLWCLENVMQYINANAYTIIAIEGVSFCASTKKSFTLIMKNALRCAMINSVGDFLLLLCKLAVTVLSVGLAILWFQVPINNIEAFKFSILPLVVVALIAFLISHSFFTVYEMVIDALMVCFCEDLEANDGSEERPYYMSKSLKAFVDESDSTTILINGD